METKYLIEHLHEWHENLISELCKDDVMTCDDLCGYPAGPCIVIQAADLLEAQQKRIAELEAALQEQAERRWVPVTERLPEEWVDVLVWSLFGFCEVAVYLGIPGKWRVTWNHGMLDDNTVTHWMPLTEPPKEDAT